LFCHAVTSKLTICYHGTVIESNGTPFALQRLKCCNDPAENDMKIYLLMMLIGTLLAAVRFTSAPDQRSDTLPQ
jgi:hypothetical protein